MTKPFPPQVFTEEEITSLLSQVSDEEIAHACRYSLTPLKSTILFRGEPGGTVVHDYEGYAYPTIPRIKLIDRLSTLFPGEPRKVCLNTQGGGAAIEAAMKRSGRQLSSRWPRSPASSSTSACPTSWISDRRCAT